MRIRKDWQIIKKYIGKRHGIKWHSENSRPQADIGNEVEGSS